MTSRPRAYSSRLFAALSVLVVAAGAVRTGAVPYPFTGLVFGLTAAPDGSLLASDTGIGVFEIRRGDFSQVASLPGATDVAALGRGEMFVTTSLAFGGDGKLYRASRGSARVMADLLDFETRVNPDGGIIESNPFNIAILNGGSVLVADAAANALLIVNNQGDVDWVATLPNEIVSTANAKQIFGCPGSGLPQCGLPETMPAQAVATSVAIGPDGAYYVGELKGFPAPRGESRVWRIEPGTRHAVCGSSPACRVVADGFTSIVDLAFRGNSLLVAELDEASWLAMEAGQGIGGTLNSCDSRTWTCTAIATNQPQLTAVAVANDGAISIVTHGAQPGAGNVSTLP
jgi:hypothetical protein